jgi:hypothetical protein
MPTSPLLRKILSVVGFVLAVAVAMALGMGNSSGW